MDIAKAQAFLRASGVDGWLFTDHHGRDPIAQSLLGEAVGQHATRRWYYLIPAEGQPRKLVHRIETSKLRHLPGIESQYSQWQEHSDGIRALCQGLRRVAMQYSENGGLLLLSNVDAGVVDLVRSTGVEVVSSGDLVSQLVAVLSPEQCEMHLEAGRRIDKIRAEAFDEVRRSSTLPDELTLQRFLLRRFADEGIETQDGPVVGSGPNSGDPHYEPGTDKNRQLQEGDVLLLDMWGKLKSEPEAPYYDITWVASLGAPRDERVDAVFSAVKTARDSAIALVQNKVGGAHPIRGYEVDQAARASIVASGYARQFTHRTGHSIGKTVHGFGPNMDDFECRDERLILPGSCFSIEPGIYLPEFGIRLEINMLVESGSARVTGEAQRALCVL